eukprot:CAMPEP_0181322620 /NCGR_PEP_ID=MMETSP1101-20121128/19326_1 /TAXON_ID=46948 /ORGANISM="Rhodomonas abbreviata, Strain Caron Lab Isolate" /LENGTH=527 /DNA_ID=CAMNT_0023430547 /DNA_START=177 /DNA_END=1760 /DNA_ORIENTATION=-
MIGSALSDCESIEHGNDAFIEDNAIIVDRPTESLAGSSAIGGKNSKLGICVRSDSSRASTASDHSDCDLWGPSVLMSKGFEDILSEGNVQEVPRDYVMDELIQDIASKSVDEDPFYVVDLTSVIAKLSEWKERLPRVKPFYAIKCNGDSLLTNILARAGCGFDCASKAEIEQALAMGVSPDSIVYANPCKQSSMLRYARSRDVKLMTADNVEELHKISNTFPEARVVIRIAVDDSKSVCRFNSKFGAPEHEWDLLLRTCAELDLDLVGFSFHVGSGCGDLKPFADAVSSARDAFNAAKAYGFNPYILDCGGGFPGTDDGEFAFREVAATISDAIEHHFPASEGVEVIAEPGRYMACSSHTYAVCVIAKRQLSESHLADTDQIESFGTRPGKDDGNELCKDAASSSSGFGSSGHGAQDSKQPEVAVYINDGCYGSFNCVVFDHAEVSPHVMGGGKQKQQRANPPTLATKVFGPTCDSIDVVLPCTRLPPLDVGDWLWFPAMGAYTRCAASRFNGQGEHSVHYVWSGMP